MLNINNISENIYTAARQFATSIWPQTFQERLKVTESLWNEIVGQTPALKEKEQDLAPLKQIAPMISAFDTIKARQQEATTATFAQGIMVITALTSLGGIAAHLLFGKKEYFGVAQKASFVFFFSLIRYFQVRREAKEYEDALNFLVENKTEQSRNPLWQKVYNEISSREGKEGKVVSLWLRSLQLAVGAPSAS